jgi:hypothetical protein
VGEQPYEVRGRCGPPQAVSAIADWEAALKIDPNNPGVRKNLEFARKERVSSDRADALKSNCKEIDF